MAAEISDRPSPREMDMLLSTGERISCALCAMAIWDLGHQAISLTGSQAGIVTDSSHTKARIVDVRADRIEQAPRGRQDRPRRRLPGRLDRFQGRDHARPRRLRHHRRRARRRARRQRLRDLHRRRRRLQRRPADRPERPQAAGRLLRGDARDVGFRSEGAAAAQRRVRAQPRRPDPLPLLVRGGHRYPRGRRGRDHGEPVRNSRDPLRRGGPRDACRAFATSPAWRAGSSPRWPTPTSTST